MSDAARPGDRDGGASLEELTRQVAALDDAGVADHPEVLDAVHTALLAELDALAGAARPLGPEPQPDNA